MQMVWYAGCSTCTKARKWLEAKGANFSLRDIKTQTPTAEELGRWHAQSGLPLKKFFNTSGQVYRGLGLTSKLPNMGEEEQLALLASDGMLIKRPILVSDSFVLVGFKEAEWEAALEK